MKNNFLPDEVNTPNLLVDKTNKLISLEPTSSSVQPLIKEINSLLRLRINNELKVLGLIEKGLIHDDGTISDIALNMHKSSKDSISELIKVKLNLEGIATEHKSVVHRFDVNGLLEALREARKGRAGRDGMASRVEGRDD